MPRTLPIKATRGIQAHWDELSSLGRLELILEYAELFLALRLITESELTVVRKMSPVEWEYIIIREEHPIFTSLDLHQDFENQYHSSKLLAALRAVFD